jgi:hypothetical protein
MYTHQFDNERTLSLVRDSLPYSLPLYRRIQSPHRSTTAQILGSIPADDFSLSTTRNRCFVLAFTDRSARPETETWLFAPGEMPSHSPPDGPCTCFQKIRKLLSYLSKVPAPEPTSRARARRSCSAETSLLNGEG